MTDTPMTFPLTWLRTGLRKLRGLVAPKRADILGREQGQAMVRVVVCTIVFFYLLVHLSRWISVKECRIG